MFCAGDEFMNTQRGNNNPYNQDNDLTWLDWDLLDQNSDIFRFFRNMIAFRKNHPSISRSRFWRDDIRWHGTTGDPDLTRDSHCLAFLLEGAALNDADIYVMINGSSEPVEFVVQEIRPEEWLRVIDTSLTAPEDFCDPGSEARIDGSTCRLNPRSIVVLLRQS